MSEYLKSYAQSGEIFRMDMPQSRLTVQSENSYARRGNASMQDKQSEVIEAEILPTKIESVEKTTEEEKKEPENEQVRELKIQLDELKEEDIKEMSEEDLKKAYKLLYKNLASVKSSNPIKVFIRSLGSARDTEKAILRQLDAKKVKTSEIRELRDEALDEGIGSGDETKRKEHIIADMNNEKSNALRHAWQRYFTPEELKHEDIQQAIEDAVLAGFRPTLETATLYKPGFERTETSDRILEKAQAVNINSTLEDEDRKQKAWEVILQSREEAYNAEVARREAISNDTGVPQEPVPPPPATIEEVLVQENPTKYEGLTGEEREEQLRLDREAKEQAIIDAHNVGADTGVYKFSYSQIKKKHDVLQQAGFTREDTRSLMQEGITGREATIEPPRNGESAKTWDPLTDTPLAPPVSRSRSEFEFSDAEMERLMQLRSTRELKGETEEGPDIGYDPDADADAIQLKAARDLADNLADRISAIEDATRLREFLESPEGLNGNIRRVGEMMAMKNQDMSRETSVAFFKLQFEENIQKALDAIKAGDVARAKSIAKGEVEKLYDREKSHYEDLKRRRLEMAREVAEGKRGREGYLQINNIEDVAKAIMQTNPELWGTRAYIRDENIHFTDENNNPIEEGKFPLLQDAIDENGNVKMGPDGKPLQVINEVNFKRWVRERIVRFHNFDPDSPVQFGSTIGLENPNLLRNVNLGIMINQEGLFFKSVDGTLKKDLRDDIERTIWLITEARNMDLIYRQGMKKDTNFADMLIEIFKKNTFGKDYLGVNNLANLFTMDADFKSGDKKIGHAMRAAYLMYYNMTDEKKLAELFPGDFELYDQKTMKDAIKKVMEDNNRDADSEQAQKDFTKDAQISKLLDMYDEETGKIPPGKRTKFLTEINIFNPPGKNRLQIALGRALVNRTAARRTGLTVEDEAEGIKNDFDSANFAEMLSLFLTYWTGAASRQDISFAAINAFGKTEHFQKYLDKQADPSRAGGIGNPHDYTLAKKLTADPMEGILTDHRQTTIELIEAMQNLYNQEADVETRKKKEDEIVRKWTYAHDAWAQYPSQHVGNAFKEFLARTEGKEIRLDKFAHWDKDHKAVVYDAHHMIDEVQENLIKPTRYRWSTHRLPYWHEQSVVQVDKKTKEVTYKTETLVERMFGNQVLQIAERIYLNEMKDKGAKPFLDDHGHLLRDANHKLLPHVYDMMYNKDTEKEFSRVLSKAYLVAKFGAMIGGHTTTHGTEPYLPFYTRRTIINALGTIPAGIEGDEHDMMHTHATEFYFTDFDLKEMQRISGNTFWKSMFQEARKEARRGFMEGLKKGLGKTIQSMFK